ncbi:enolase C-terminal domain-like protein [Variovorax sp. J22R24]|uniref:enolase C-terminal domain-like protein n=1 Tax=Variovorax gracilis TaxID=3053502 RepID=UPI002578B234|nr:enolase C-terminal domain-like protein [Variovorax sp. J22R24]MDM0105829.1 enolase C-terminal domain-like protein [Variovorax sp. J22R24]
MTSSSAPPVRVLAVEFGVRPMTLRLPFKFGAVTLTRCPQVFVHATVDCGTHGAAEGWAAELMVPRWFDKRDGFSQADNVRHLQQALEAVADAYRTGAPLPAFALFARHYEALMAHGASLGMTALSTAFGQAVLDRAVLDALCRAMQIPVHAAFQRNLVGIGDTPLANDLAGWDWNAWLATLTPSSHLYARHTVGMLDVLEGDVADAAGLPASLPAVVRRYGHRFFKVKLGGHPEADLARVDAVLATLDAVAPGHQFTLDGNEQYANSHALRALCDGLRSLPRLAARPEALLYLEQPLPRDASMDSSLTALDAPAPLLLDEADGTLEAFAIGRLHGWRGVSSKACKGLYKAVINRARCDHWNLSGGTNGSRFFMSAEDLTCQAGLAVQQDLALASLLGLSHCERNGHHYVDGFGDAPSAEQAGFAAVHSDLYETSAGRPRLSIRDGRLAIASLGRPGFAHCADPDFDSLQPLSHAPALV